MSKFNFVNTDNPRHGEQKICPCLWFDSQAEDAATFYVSIFKDSKIENITRYGKEGFEIHHMKEGTVMTVEFQLEGQKFLGLNGGPVFQFNESISFQIMCDSQEEIDYYWNKLSDRGDPNAQQCGWLKDRYNLSWQVIPRILPRLMNDRNQKKSQNVMHAMLQMKKINIDELQAAYDCG
jgi:predicted 3-demethylubiquinone-9 3-methyltransferase (glyoxalase superfamily)